MIGCGGAYKGEKKVSHAHKYLDCVTVCGSQASISLAKKKKNTHTNKPVSEVCEPWRASKRVSMLPGRLSPGWAHNPVWLLKHAGGGCCICV